MKTKALLLGTLAAAALALPAQAERGSDGHLNILYWQAPSLLNPYLTGGTKDEEAASLVIEGLARYDNTGALVPFLADGIPTVENGGVSADLTSITWKLKEGLKWSDGSDVTSEDVKFTAEYCMHPEGGCAQAHRYEGVKSVEATDARTVVVTFESPKPNPYGPFVGSEAPIIQKAQFQDCLGAAAPSCTEANFAPIGTGPFKVDEFRPNDVITFSANDQYRDPSKPAFATVTFKGGGDAKSAARAVLETGEFDYAWNLQLAPDVLDAMKGGGKGQIVAAFSNSVERLELNMTDPSPDLPEGERSTVAHAHPAFSDLAVRQAMSMAIDRALLAEIGYGPAGRATCNLVPAPALYASDNTGCLTQDISGANKLLDDAGWAKGPDGVREKDGVRLSLLFATSTNAVRQDYQALIKAWWQEIGIETELRNIAASVFFGGDPGSPDTVQKFYADVTMYTNSFPGTDPEAYLSARVCGNEPKPASQWQGSNINRFCDAEYDELIKVLSATGELSKRGDLSKKLNEMLTKDSLALMPLVDRGFVSAHANSLGGVVLNPWDTEIWNIADWHRVK
jgi:peptide/nickel transport system substrate-binding protein